MRSERSPRSSSDERFPKLRSTALQQLMKSGGGTSGMGFSSSGCSPSAAFMAFSAVPGTSSPTLGVKASSRSCPLSSVSSALRSCLKSLISFDVLCLSFSSYARLLSRFISSPGPFAPASKAIFAFASINNKNGSSIFPSLANLTILPSILMGSPIDITSLIVSVATAILFSCSTLRASKTACASLSPLSTRSFKTLINCASN
mmetsp:Transcript_17573/g.20980  ORF Transcript_17573/g.20980 Transcript_17573/m.20980 type:complete len:203 (-) Transcript_17573:814-1422(-)